MTDSTHLTLVEPAEDQAEAPRVRRDKRSGNLQAWLDSCPGVMSGSTPAKMMIKAQRSFGKFEGKLLSEKSPALDWLDQELSFLGFRGGSVVYRGETKWLLVLPQKTK